MSSRAFSTYDVELAQRRVLGKAVGQLAGQGGAFKRAFAPRLVACPARRLPRARSVERFGKQRFGRLRVFFKISRQLVVQHGGDQAAHLGVAELALGLPFKLRVGQLDGDHGGQTFAHVVAGKVFVVVL